MTDIHKEILAWRAHMKKERLANDLVHTIRPLLSEKIWFDQGGI